MNYIDKIKKEVEDKPLWEQLAIVSEYVILNNPKNYKSGVYLIEDFYVGKSKNIISRIASHVLEVINADTHKVVHNKEKLFLICEILKTRKLNVKVLDKDQEKEETYIKKLYNDLPLTNVEFVTKEMSNCKREKYQRETRNKPLEIKVVNFTLKFKVAYVKLNNLYIFKISTTEARARGLLKEYLKYKNDKIVKKRNNPIKDIQYYKYVAIKSKGTKVIYNQNENWEERLKNCRKGVVRGFDDIFLARQWLFGRKAQSFLGE